MSIKKFFTPSNFQHDMLKSQQKTAQLIALGKTYMRENRGEKWFNFFMWLPIVGNFVFYKEGKKAKQEEIIRHKNIPKHKRK